jgi:Cof subfamily protein (haloacid dehalogenase superfamily)
MTGAGADATRRMPPPEALSPIRLVVTDVDGTLLDGSHRVPTSTREAIARAQRRGVTVMLSTSRGPAVLLPVLRDLRAVDGEHFVAAHGAVTGVYRGANGLELRSRRTMELEAAGTVTEIGTALGLCANWFVGDRWLASGVDACVRREIDIVRVAPTVTDLSAEIEPPDKVLFMADSRSAYLLDELAAALPADLQAQVSNPSYLEVTARGVDKGAAIAALAEDLGYGAEEVLAVGDGPNDLSMFAWAGMAVAPANARPEVIAAADFLTASNLEDGVGRLLDAIRPER